MAGDGVHHRVHQFTDAGAAGPLIVPVHGDEQFTAAHAVGHVDLHDGAAPLGFDARQLVVQHLVGGGGVRMNFHKRLWFVRVEWRGQCRSGHGVPLIPDASGVQRQRPTGADRVADSATLRGHELGFAVGCAEVAVGVQALGILLPGGWPLLWLQVVVLCLGEVCQVAQVQLARGVAVEAGQTGVLAKNVGGRAVGKVGAESHGVGNVGQNAPVLTRFAGRLQAAPLA